MHPVRRQISPHASRLRRDMTDVERTLWAVLRNRQLEGFKFRRQATIGPFVVDFRSIDAALLPTALRLNALRSYSLAPLPEAVGGI